MAVGIAAAAIATVIGAGAVAKDGGAASTKGKVAVAVKADGADAPGMWMGVTEEEFKQLHELKQDAPAALKGEMVQLGEAKGYLSLPPGAKGPLPAVIVIHEWWGLNDHIKHWADRLAADGYAALAVDLYRGELATTPDRAMELIKAVEDEPSLKALRAGIDFLESDPRVKATHIGSIGWCFGGHWSLRTALLDPDLDACVLYYGRPVTEVAQLAGIKAEVLGVFGTQDASLPEETVGGFEAALKEAGVKARILRYDAVHAFANPSNPKYDQVSAGKAWDEVRELFGRTLKPGK
ncbi:MAG: dienelactone hydrolase family protein [Candidatus Eisenbacteria bacterium]|nr:dienelactone hydrolase family protein [Candidatus Eisenbacteria bacterium]MCC7141740.1 dienelactone hydrolase family protein [Candidatus Eisenbacteria bacterium]